MTRIDVDPLREIAEVEFSDIVVGAIIPDINELRIMCSDGSFRWQTVGTFPNHFHKGSEYDVFESHLSRSPQESLREFLLFIRGKLLTGS